MSSRVLICGLEGAGRGAVAAALLPLGPWGPAATPSSPATSAGLDAPSSEESSAPELPQPAASPTPVQLVRMRGMRNLSGLRDATGCGGSRLWVFSGGGTMYGRPMWGADARVARSGEGEWEEEEEWDG